MSRSLRSSIAPLALLALLGCTEDGKVNIFSIEDDKDLGAQLADEIASNPDEYPLLDEGEYPDAYDTLYAMRDAVLDSGQVTHRDDFDWETYIIDDDEVLNAFCAPGGYIYVYTGILRYLEVEDHFVGVLGHEIAHADQRHSTEQLTKIYGIETLLSIVLGDDPGLVAEIAEGLLSLSFSRANEAEADEYSVRYLCETDYAANGTAGFFEKLTEDGSIEIPEFLSTHPSSDSRIEDINAWAETLGCSVELNPDADWDGFIATLP